MVRPKAETFGFDELDRQFVKYEKNVDESKNVLEDTLVTMRDSAKSIASSKGLRVTGAGVDGITEEATENGGNVGWSTRPNLHLYFWERGFHLTNPNSNSRVQRDSRGARKRHYKSGQTLGYFPPKPHMQPAFEQHKGSFLRNMKRTIEK